MKTTKKLVSQRIAAGAGAFALGVAGLAGITTAAAADVGPDQEGHPTTGSLTVHKHLGEVQDFDNDGTEQPLPEDTQANGVVFSLQQVGVLDGENCVAIDLSTQDGWEDVEGATASAPAAPESPFCLIGDPVEQETEGDGSTTFANLELGLYYVKEIGDNGGNNIVQPTAPFYVTVPYPSGTQPGEDDETIVEWTYDVHVYPKNATADVPKKTIDETEHGLKVGDEVTWTISQTVPTLNEDAEFTQASITDVLDSRLVLASATLKLNGTKLDAADWEDGTPEYTWEFTEQGLAKLDEAQGGIITVELKTTVASVGDGTIENAPWDPETGNGYYSQFNNEPPIPGEETPFTYWGELQIKKVDQSDPAKGLEGAVFNVYEAPESGTCAVDEPNSGSIAEGTSIAGGLVVWDAGAREETILGLLIKNSNTEVTPAPSKDFCVYETKAPAGYTGAGVQTVNITAGELVTGTNGDITVENVQKDGPDLPLTGANGTMLMTIGGLGLISLAAGTYLVSRRRRVNA